MVEETNDIGTAYLRLDLLPADAQPVLRESFRRYLDARIEIYRKLPDIAAAKDQLAKADEVQIQIWRQAVAASLSKDAPPPAAILLLPVLNAMIDITTTQVLATLMCSTRLSYSLAPYRSLAGTNCEDAKNAASFIAPVRKMLK